MTSAITPIYLTSRIIYARRKDGGVSIVSFAPSQFNRDTSLAFDSDALIRKVIPDGVDFDVIEVSALSTDRTFRNAWEKGDGECVTNLVKALVIAKENIRVVRNAKLLEFDIAMIRADEDGDTALKTAIIEAKTRLRDATLDLRIVDATTEADLKKGMVAVLKDVQEEAAVPF